jgi:hypothetical protein
MRALLTLRPAGEEKSLDLDHQKEVSELIAA